MNRTFCQYFLNVGKGNNAGQIEFIIYSCYLAYLLNVNIKI